MTADSDDPPAVIGPGAEVIYPAYNYRSGFILRVVSVDGDMVTCFSERLREHVHVEVSKLRLNDTDGS